MKQGRGGRSDEEEGGTRREEGRGGRRDEESETMKKLFEKMKNEKVAKGRIIGLAGPCFFVDRILLSIRCLYERRSFDQQWFLGSTVLSSTPTPHDNTDKDYARSIDTDIFANKDPRIALKPSVTDRRRHENSFRRGPYFRGAPSTRESVRLRRGHSYLFFQYPSR